MKEFGPSLFSYIGTNDNWIKSLQILILTLNSIAVMPCTYPLPSISLCRSNTKQIAVDNLTHRKKINFFSVILIIQLKNT